MKFELVYPNGEQEVKGMEDITTIPDVQVQKAIKYLASESMYGCVGLTLTSGVYVGVLNKKEEANV